LNELEPVVWLIVFVISITAHEAAHAWAAYLGGDPTAYLGGQVSLNPLPHMRREPFGMVVIPLISTFTNGFPIGWASTPYDPRWEELHPRRAAWMAAAGPAANLALALAALVALRVGLEVGVFSLPAQLDATHLVVASTDSVAENTKFAQATTVTLPGRGGGPATVVEKKAADFPMLSDESKAVATAYGVLNPRGFTNRWTFYIDKAGKVAAIDKAVRPETSAEDMIAKLGELKVAMNHR